MGRRGDHQVLFPEFYPGDWDAVMDDRQYIIISKDVDWGIRSPEWMDLFALLMEYLFSEVVRPMETTRGAPLGGQFILINFDNREFYTA